MPLGLPSGQNTHSINNSTKEAYRNNGHQAPEDGIRIPSPGYAGGQVSIAAAMTKTSP